MYYSTKPWYINTVDLKLWTVLDFLSMGLWLVTVCVQFSSSADPLNDKWIVKLWCSLRLLNTNPESVLRVEGNRWLCIHWRWSLWLGWTLLDTEFSDVLRERLMYVNSDYPCQPKKTKTTNIYHCKSILIHPAVWICIKVERSTVFIYLMWFESGWKLLWGKCSNQPHPTQSPLCNLEIKNVDCCIVVTKYAFLE